MNFDKLKICFCITGSFCTMQNSLEELKKLSNYGVDLYPVFSYNAYSIDTRFGMAREYVQEVERISKREAIHSIVEAEKIGPIIKPDFTVIAPCTGNTLSKLVNGITDTPVLMATKSHLRNVKPLIIALATNDALGVNAANFGKAINDKNIYFVPLCQDNILAKPNSMIFKANLVTDTIEYAAQGVQIQPIYCQ